jgi:hypothetical protein
MYTIMKKTMKHRPSGTNSKSMRAFLSVLLTTPFGCGFSPHGEACCEFLFYFPLGTVVS